MAGADLDAVGPESFLPGLPGHLAWPGLLPSAAPNPACISEALGAPRPPRRKPGDITSGHHGKGSARADGRAEGDLRLPRLPSAPPLDSGLASALRLPRLSAPLTPRL